MESTKPTAIDTTPARPAAGERSPSLRSRTRRVPLGRGLLRVLSVGLSAPSRTTRRSWPLLIRTREESTPTVEHGAAERFDRFYRGNYPSVVRLAYSLCGSLSVAEELAQEAFVSAHQRWHRIAGYERPDLWVRRAVINRSMSHRRREATERRALDRIREQREHQLELRPEPMLADEGLWRALRELSGRQAEVLALFYVEDQPLSEVAAILGLGEETVKTHLKRGRAALAARLEATEREDRP